MTSAPAADREAAYLAAALEAFDRRAARVGLHEHDLVLGEVRVRLRVAGDGLARVLLRALRPRLGTPAGEPRVVLHAADGQGLPPLPWTAGELGARAEVRGTGPVVAALQGDSRSVHLLDVRTGTGMLWTASPQSLGAWEVGAPFRALLGQALTPLGVQLVHGAVVGDDEGAVLLAAPGGSGKSTSVLLALRDGLRTCGDDYVAVTLGPAPAAHGLYDVLKLTREALVREPDLDAHVVLRPLDDDQKPQVVLSEAFPGAFAAEMPLRAIVVPHVGRSTGRPTPIGPAQAVRALAPTTLMQLPGAGPAALQAMSALVRALPAYGLQVGPDGGVPSALRRLR